MPGFLGGSTGGGGGTGGEISFPKEFVDPVTKLRVSNPENLIDTDFEYGLQPTKWETVELINNTPSFFSKSGDTTIPNILAITTNAGTREITVVTASEHSVSSGIPIQVQGTKSVTADGSYIVNSIPNPNTFTYLCKANQATTSSIEDLYSSIITGEFFQGSQIRIADASGIVTDDEAISLLTVTTESAHGFKANTPFYFLNLNSTISQEFQANNNAAKSFDSTNSAVAQTFDGSNTLSSINIDWSNSATVGGSTSTVTAVSTVNNTITVAHGVENFLGQVLGTPVYYAVTGGAGYFINNPRGVIFLKSTDGLGESTSTFQVSATPDGPVIDILASISGTFQLANQARTFAGNNVDPLTEIEVDIIVGDQLAFDGGNQGYVGEAESETAPNGECTVLGFTADSILVSTEAGAGLDYYVGAMVFYSTTGSAASGLTNNTTYFIAEFAPSSGDLFNIRLKVLPNNTEFLAPSGGSGTQTFTKIGVSVDKDIIHIKDSNFDRYELLEYTSPAAGEFGSNYQQKFYYVDVAYDTHNYALIERTFLPVVATGGTIFPDAFDNGRLYKVHGFTVTGSSNFVVQSAPAGSEIEYLVVGGGGGGGADMGGGGGGGGVLEGTAAVSVGSYPIVVGAGGLSSNRAYGSRYNVASRGDGGQSSSAFGVTALGGGGGAGVHDANSAPATGVNQGFASGGGSSGRNNNYANGTSGQGNRGGSTGGSWYAGGGGGAGGAGSNGRGGSGAFGGTGKSSSIFGTTYWFGGGGGGSGYSQKAGDGGRGGGGGGGHWSAGGPGFGNTEGINAGGNSTGSTSSGRGGSGGANTGAGAGGHAHQAQTNARGGGSGVVVVRYPITDTPSPGFPIASGGTTSFLTVGEDRYAIHKFTTTGSQTFTITNPGSADLNTNILEVLVVGGGGGGGFDMGGGGGGGAVVAGTVEAVAGTYTVNVGGGGFGNGANLEGNGNAHQYGAPSRAGGDSTLVGPGAALNLRAKGGGFGGSSYFRYAPGPTGGTGGNGGGASGYSDGGTRNGGGTTQAAQGVRTGLATVTSGATGFGGGRGGGQYYSGGGGGAGGVGTASTAKPNGGPGVPNAILGPNYFWGGGGGGSGYSSIGGDGGSGGGGGGGARSTGGIGLGSTTGINPGLNGLGRNNAPGGAAGANTGGGGGGGTHYNSDTKGGNGSTGIVVIRYKIEPQA